MLDERQKKLAEGNIRLAYFTAKRFRNLDIEQEEIEAAALLGITKAAGSFRQENGNAFSTFAVKCINNEIFQLCRKNRRQIKTVSLETPLKDGENLYIKDILPDPKDEMEEIDVLDSFESAGRSMNAREQEVLKLKMRYPEITQKEIGRILHISQGGVSKILSSIKGKVREEWEK